MQLVLVTSNRDESDPVSDLVLLQVSLGQVLQVLTREVGASNNDDLVSVFSDGDLVTQVTWYTFDLDVLTQKFNISLLVKNTIFGRSRGVDN